MQKHFYVSHNSHDLGPFTKEEIEKKIKTKELDVFDYVFLESKDDWVLLSDFLGQAVPPKVIKKKEEIPTHIEKVAYASVSLRKEPAAITKTAYPVANAPVPPPIVKNQIQTKKAEDSVSMRDGHAHVAITGSVAETVVISIINSSKSGLDCSAKVQARFLAGDAVKFQFDEVSNTEVGKPVSVRIKAVDKYGNIDTAFRGQVTLSSDQKIEGIGTLKFVNGFADAQVTTTVAGTSHLQLTQSSDKKIDCSESVKIHFKAGSAVKFLLEQPQDVKVGEKLIVKVHAVDQYGNLDNHFTGSVTVAVSGSAQANSDIHIVDGQGRIELENAR